MQFTPESDGVVAVTASGTEFRAVLVHLSPAVGAVIADQARWVVNERVVTLRVYADAAAEISYVWDGIAHDDAEA
jgi:hypothetical protein